MWDYLFSIEDPDNEDCGEIFFVECETRSEAYKVAQKNFPKVELFYHGRWDPDSAAAIGIDTY